MQEVQALMRRRLPGATSARTDWMFGFQRRGVRRCECDTDIPKPGPLPQTSHPAATVDHSQEIRSRTAARRRARTQTNEESNRSSAETSRRSAEPRLHPIVQPAPSVRVGTLRPCCRRSTTPRSASGAGPRSPPCPRPAAASTTSTSSPSRTATPARTCWPPPRPPWPRSTSRRTAAPSPPGHCWPAVRCSGLAATPAPSSPSCGAGWPTVPRDAGVVDAGGGGLCLALDALVTTVTGVGPDRPSLARRSERGPHHAHDHGDLPHQPPAGPGSEVQYLLADSDEAAVARLQERLAALGDSLVVVGVDTPGGREWNVHVHAVDVGAAIEAGIEAGRPYRISVTPLAPVRPPAPVPDARAVVAIVPDGGLTRLFGDEGATVVPSGPDGVREDDVLAAVLASGAAGVVVLPNDPALTALASRAAERAREEGRDVVVVPTRSPVQGLAALAVADPTRRFSDDVITMAEAAAATRWAELTVAEQEALTSAGRCAPGDVLGSAEGDVLLIGAEPVTLVVGPDADLADAVCTHLAGVHPTVEVTRYDGAPEGVPLQVGVE